MQRSEYGSCTRPQSAWLATIATAGQQRAQARGDAPLAGLAGAAPCRRASNGTVEPLNASRMSADRDDGGVEQPRARRATASAPAPPSGACR